VEKQNLRANVEIRFPCKVATKTSCTHVSLVVAEFCRHVLDHRNLLARLQTWRALIFSRVCLSVCLCVCVCVCVWPALLPFNLDRFCWNLVTGTLLWSSLAATIMVQIGRRGTSRRLFENLKKFSKITEFEFQNSGPSFFASVSPVYCKKIRLYSNKTDGRDKFW